MESRDILRMLVQGYAAHASYTSEQSRKVRDSVSRLSEEDTELILAFAMESREALDAFCTDALKPVGPSRFTQYLHHLIMSKGTHEREEPVLTGVERIVIYGGRFSPAHEEVLKERMPRETVIYSCKELIDGKGRDILRNGDLAVLITRHLSHRNQREILIDANRCGAPVYHRAHHNAELLAAEVSAHLGH